MSIPMVLLAVAGTVAAPNGDMTTIACSLASPDGSQFSVNGHFDSIGLHSNLSGLTQVEGAFTPMSPEPIIVTDGTQRYGWSLEKDDKKFDAFLTQYGSETAVLLLERRKFVGRHWGRNLIGVGLCNVQRRQAVRKPS